MPTRLGTKYKVHLSIIDQKPCCFRSDGCTSTQICECRTCRLCGNRSPKSMFYFQPATDKYGRWIGPHCFGCHRHLKCMHLFSKEISTSTKFEHDMKWSIESYFIKPGQIQTHRPNHK